MMEDICFFQVSWNCFGLGSKNYCLANMKTISMCEAEAWSHGLVSYGVQCLTE